MRSSVLLVFLLVCYVTFTHAANKVSYYELLGVEQNAEATELKKAYRVMALKYHPDKCEGDPDECHRMFIQLNKAFQVLKDPEKRAEYDQLLSRGQTEYREEWEYDPDQVYEDLYGLDEEHSLILISIITVGSMSYPAFVVWQKRVAGAAAAQKKKKDMLGSIQKSQRSAVTPAPAPTPTCQPPPTNKTPIEDDDDTTELRSQQRKEKEHNKKIRGYVRTVCKNFLIVEEGEKQGKKPITTEEVDLVCSTLTPDELSSLVSQLCSALSLDSSSLDDTTLTSITPSQQEISSAKLVMRVPVDRIRAKQLEQKTKEKAKMAEQKFQQRKAAEEQAAMNTVEWTPEELSMLAKGMAKYPGGIAQRWERITEMVNQVGKRSIKQVTAKAKETEVLKPLAKDANSAAFNSYKQNVKKLSPSVDASISSSSNSSTSSTSSIALNDLSVAVAASFAQLAEQSKGSNVSLHQPAVTVTTNVKSTSVEKKDKEEKQCSAPVEWTAEQQAALEMALRTVPRDAEDRWDQIAALVPGRTRKQVVQRFKEIKALVMSNAV